MHDREHPAHDAVARAVGAVALAAVALVHLLDLHDTFVETPYKGWLFVGLIAGSSAAAVALVRRGDARAWAAGGVLALGALGGYVWSRTVGLPGGAGDVGNWWEPLGVASLFLEASVVALAASALAPVSSRSRAPATRARAGARATDDSRARA